MFCILHTYTVMSTNKTDADTVAEFQIHEYCKWACYSIGNVEQTKMFVTCYNKCVEKTKQDIEDQKVVARLNILTDRVRCDRHAL